MALTEENEIHKDVNATMQVAYAPEEADSPDSSDSSDDHIEMNLSDNIRHLRDTVPHSAPAQLKDIQKNLETFLRDPEIFSRLLEDVQRYKNENSAEINNFKTLLEDINNFDLQLGNHYHNPLVRAIAVILSLPANALPLELFTAPFVGVAVGFNSTHDTDSAGIASRTAPIGPRPPVDEDSIGLELGWFEAEVLTYVIVYAMLTCCVGIMQVFHSNTGVRSLFPREYDSANPIIILLRTLLWIAPIMNEARTVRFTQWLQNQFYSMGIQAPQLTEEEAVQFRGLLERYNTLAMKPEALDEERDYAKALEKIQTIRRFYNTLANNNNHPLKSLLIRFENITARLGELEADIETSRGELVGELDSLSQRFESLRGFNAIIASENPRNVLSIAQFKTAEDKDVRDKIGETRDEYVSIQEKIESYNQRYENVVGRFNQLKADVEKLQEDLAVYKEERISVPNIVVVNGDDENAALLPTTSSSRGGSSSGLRGYGSFVGTIGRGEASSSKPSKKPSVKGKEKEAAEEEEALVDSPRRRSPSPSQE